MHTIAQLISTFDKHTPSDEVCKKLNGQLFELGLEAFALHLPSDDQRNRHFMIDFNEPSQAFLLRAALAKSKSVLFGYSAVVFSVTDD